MYVTSPRRGASTGGRHRRAARPQGRDVRVSLDPPPPGVLLGHANPHPGPDPRVPRGRGPVRAEPNPEIAFEQVSAVEGARHAHPLAELGWPAQEVLLPPGGRSGGPDGLEAGDRRPRPQEDRTGHALRPAHDVGAPVHPVGEIDVEVAGRAEHRRVPPGRSPVGVGGRILGAPVRLDLDDPGHPLPVDEQGVQQPGGHVDRVAVQETERHRPRPAGGPGHEGAGPGSSPASTPSLVRSTSSRRAKRPSWSATAVEPAPPGVVRRLTATPGSSSFAPVSPRSGCAWTSSSRGTWRWTESRTSPATSPWAWRKGIPCSTRYSARSTAAAEDVSAADCMRSWWNSTVATSPARARRATSTWPTASNSGSLS